MNAHLDGDAQDEHGGHRDEQPEEQADVQLHRQRVAEVRAEYDQDALGDVDDVEDAEDQGQADRHQGVDTSDEYPVDDGLVDLRRHALSAVLVRAQLDQFGLGLMIATDPAALVGRTWLKAVPLLCHWKVNAAEPEFLPSSSNFTGPWTVLSVTPLCR